MSNLFDYARKRIKKQYRSRYDYSFQDVKEKELWDIHQINYYEECSKKNLKNAIKFRFKALWYVLDNDERIFIVVSIPILIFISFLFFRSIAYVSTRFLILNIAESCFWCFIIAGLVFLYRMIRKRIIKNKVFYVIIAALFLFSIPYIPIIFGHQTTQIGDFYESNEYIEKYFVLMSREPETVNDRKCYTLPAEIERREDFLYSFEADEVYTLNYHINYLYFPNGGYLSFNYDESYEYPEYTAIYLNKETKVTDYKGDSYYITLTKQKAK